MADPYFTPASLDARYDEVRAEILADRDFLQAPVSRWRRWAFALRFLAWIAVGAGLLLPLLFRGDAGALGTEASGLELAYIAVMVGALLLMADQVFNVSGSWSRLMLAALQVRKVLFDLDFAWTKLRALVANDADAMAHGPALVDLLHKAKTETHAIMETQKRDWVTRLEEGAAALSAALERERTRLAARIQETSAKAAMPSTGAIDVTIDKPGDLKGAVKILVDGEEKGGSAAPAARLSVGNIPAGQHVVAIHAERNATPPAPFVFSQSVQVQAGASATLAVTV